MSDVLDQGFSEPDPAPDQDAGFIPEKGSLLDMVSDGVSCENCAHYSVCGIIAGIRPMLDNWEAGDPDEEPPVDPLNLALVCRAFDPVELPE